MSESIRPWLLPRLVQLVTPATNQELNGDLKPAPAQLQPSTPFEDTPYTTGYRVQVLAFADSSSQGARRLNAERQNGWEPNTQPDDVWALVADQGHKVAVKLNGKEVSRWENSNQPQHLTSLRYGVLALRQFRPIVSPLPSVFENRPADSVPSIGLALEVASFDVVAIDLSPPGEGAPWFQTVPLQNAFFQDRVEEEDEVRANKPRFARWLVLQCRELEKGLNAGAPPPKAVVPAAALVPTPALAAPPAPASPSTVIETSKPVTPVARAAPAMGPPAAQSEKTVAPSQQIPQESQLESPQESQQRSETPSEPSQRAPQIPQAAPPETQGWGDFTLPDESSPGLDFDPDEATPSESRNSQPSQHADNTATAGIDDETQTQTVDGPHRPTWMRVQADRSDAFITPTPSDFALPRRSGETSSSASSSRHVGALSFDTFPPTQVMARPAASTNGSGAASSLGPTQSSTNYEPESQTRQPWDVSSSASTRLPIASGSKRLIVAKPRFAGVPMPSSSPAPSCDNERGREVTESESPTKVVSASRATVATQASDMPSPPFTLASSSGTSASNDEAQAGPSARIPMGGQNREGRGRIEEDASFEDSPPKKQLGRVRDPEADEAGQAGPSTPRASTVSTTQGGRKASILVPETQRGKRSERAPATENNAGGTSRKRSADAAALHAPSSEPEARGTSSMDHQVGPKRAKISNKHGKPKTKVKNTDKLKAVQALMARIVD